MVLTHVIRVMDIMVEGANSTKHDMTLKHNEK